MMVTGSLQKQSQHKTDNFQPEVFFMRIKTSIFLVCCVMVFQGGITAAAADSRSDQEMEKLLGLWTVVSYEDGVQKNPWEQAENQTPPVIVFQKDRFLFKHEDNVLRVGEMQLNPSASPSRMTVEIVQGLDQGAKLHGIYELEGDRFKFCLAESGNPLPSDFVAGKGLPYILGVLTRAENMEQ